MTVNANTIQVADMLITARRTDDDNWNITARIGGKAVVSVKDHDILDDDPTIKELGEHMAEIVLQELPDAQATPARVEALEARIA